MKQVTRNIDPGAARDLLERVPRACIGFAAANGPQAQPVLLNWRDPHYHIGVPESAPKPASGQEVVLLVDEGVYYFDLRAIYVRGTVQPIPEVTAGHVWFELTPTKTIAWDYGSMREVDDEA